MNLSHLFGQIVTGLVAGGGYAIVAVGLTYTLGLARVMNFAFGTLYMLAAFITATLMVRLGIGYVFAGLLTLGAASLAGFLLSRSVVIPALRISDSAVMIATLGVGVALTNLAQVAFGADVTFVNAPFINTVYHIGSAAVTLQALIVLAAAPLVTFALSLMMRRTQIGRVIRATAEAPELAGATGVNVPRVQAVAVSIGVVLAAFAAFLYSPVGVISIHMGDEVLLKSFAISALAGIGRITGALFIGIAIGVFEALVSGYISTAWSSAAIYGVLVLTLLFYPRGIFRGH